MKLSGRTDINPLEYCALWAPVVLYMALIWYLSSQPITLPPPLRFRYSDKILHAIEYGVLGYLTARAVSGTAKESRGRLFVIIVSVIIGAAWGALDEVHQGYVPNRVSCVSDAVADVVGVILGVTAFFNVRKIKTAGKNI